MATKIETTYTVEAFVRNGTNGVSTMGGKDFRGWHGDLRSKADALTLADRLSDSHDYVVVTERKRRVTITERSVRVITVERKKGEVKK